MILSALATIPQLGLVFQAATVMGAVNTCAAVRICERDSKIACPTGRSAAKSLGKSAGFRYVKPSGVFSIAPGCFAVKLGVALPSVPSSSPTSGACAAT
jgi:hypothetical protein